MISGLWKSWRNSEKRDGPLRPLQLMIIPFKPEDTLVSWEARSWQVDRLLFGDGVGWTWTVVMLSEWFIQNTRVSIWRRIQTGAGISNVRKSQILWSCNYTHRAAPWEADSQGDKFGVFSRCYFTTFDVTPAETNIALNLSMVSRLNTSFYYS